MPVLSNFNQHWIVANNFSKNPQYQIIRKSVLWKSNCSRWIEGRTAGHENAGCRFSQLFCTRCWKVRNVVSFIVSSKDADGIAHYRLGLLPELWLPHLLTIRSIWRKLVWVTSRPFYLQRRSHCLSAKKGLDGVAKQIFHIARQLRKLNIPVAQPVDYSS